MSGAPLLYALLSLMVVGWAGNYIAGKVALQVFPPVMLYGLRVTMAALLIAPVYAWQRRTHKATWTLRDLPLLVGIGVFGVALNQFLFVVGLSQTSVAHSSIFGNVTPILVLLLASMTGLEKLTPAKMVGLAVSLAGVVLLRAVDAHPHGAATFVGDLITFCGSLVFAIFTVVGKPTARQHGSITVNTVAYVGGAIAMSPLTIWHLSRFPLATVPWSAWASVFYMALGPSVICYLIYYYALGHMEASRLVAINYLLPPMASVMGVFMLGEHITLASVGAASLIFGGIYIVERAR